MSVPSTSNTPTTFTEEGHGERILQKMWKRCENEELSDVVLIAEEKRIPAHRSVLSEASEYFNRMFSSSFRESTSKVVKMPDVNGDILQRLVEYCYKGSVVISEDIAVELLKTAHLLLLADVVMACEKFLVTQLHPSNYLGFTILAEQYNCELLLQKAKEYSLENFMEMCTTDEFLQLNVEQLTQLVASDDLVAVEEGVFESLMAWMQHDSLDREQHKDKLLKLLRMPLLGRSFLISQVKPVCTTVESLLVYTEAIECYGNVPSGENLAKPRKPYQVWIGITFNQFNNKMFIHYYCVVRRKWMKLLKNLEYRYTFGTVLIKNCLCMIGGVDVKGNTLNTVRCLNLNTMTLAEISTLIEPRMWCFSAVLNGFIYVLGGFYGTNYLKTVEKWDPKTNKWNKVAPMSENRCNAGVVVLNNKLYVVGGSSAGKVISTAECYDPVQDVWQSIAPMGEGRALPGVAVANGLLYAVGGHLNNTAERYDPQTNKWTSICSLSEQLYPDGSCTTRNDKIVIFSKDGFEEYDAVSNLWKKLEFVKPPDEYFRVFSYSGKLLTSQFAEM